MNKLMKVLETEVDLLRAEGERHGRWSLVTMTTESKLQYYAGEITGVLNGNFKGDRRRTQLLSVFDAFVEGCGLCFAGRRFRDGL